MIGRLLCRLGRHDWNLMLRRVGENVPCRRPGCAAVAHATPAGWRIDSRR